MIESADSREKFWRALADRLRRASGVKNVTRRLRHWKDLQPEELPAIYIEITGEVTQQVRGQPAKVVLEANLHVYVAVDSEDDNGSGAYLNPVLDAVDATLAPDDPSNVQTLDGLVHHVWVEGQTEIFEGDLGEEAIAVVPVKMLVT